MGEPLSFWQMLVVALGVPLWPLGVLESTPLLESQRVVARFHLVGRLWNGCSSDEPCDTEYRPLASHSLDIPPWRLHIGRMVGVGDSYRIAA